MGAPLWDGQGRSRLPLLAGRYGGRGLGRNPVSERVPTGLGAGFLCPTLGAASRGHRPRAVRGLTLGPATVRLRRVPYDCPRCAQILVGPQLPLGGAGLRTCSPPCPSPPLCRGLPWAQASLRGAAPCSVRPSPMDRPRAEGCRHISRLVGSSTCSAGAGSTG